jgi:hypothetical protein
MADPTQTDRNDMVRQYLEGHPIMLERARAVIDHPEDWRLGALIWSHIETREQVTDQLVDAVRRGKF